MDSEVTKCSACEAVVSCAERGRGLHSSGRAQLLVLLHHQAAVTLSASTCGKYTTVEQKCTLTALVDSQQQQVYCLSTQ